MIFGRKQAVELWLLRVALLPASPLVAAALEGLRPPLAALGVLVLRPWEAGHTLPVLATHLVLQGRIQEPRHETMRLSSDQLQAAGVDTISLDT